MERPLIFKKSSRSGSEVNTKVRFYYGVLGWCVTSTAIGFILLLSCRFRPDQGFSSSTLRRFKLSPSLQGLDHDRLDQPQTQPPTAQELFSPDRYPVSAQLPRRTNGLVFHPNGHLLLHLPSDTLQTHPILSLIERAHIEWEAKLARQSKTLKESVKEYKRRYNRSPPAGFDKWYAYAEENRVQLIDEYDQISRDFFPFWALQPAELRKSANELQAYDRDFFQLNILNGTVSRTGPKAHSNRARELAELLTLFLPYLEAANLPPVSLFLKYEDQGENLLGWNQRMRLFELANLGQYLPKNSDIVREPDVRGWAENCSPKSLLRQSFNKTELSLSSSDKKDSVVSGLNELMSTANHSWIFHHPRAMDICANPEWIELHGSTNAPPLGPRPISPVFTMSKTSLHADILLTPLAQISPPYPGQEIPWDQRPYDKLYWRGSNTGAFFGNQQPKWNRTQRMRLYHFAHQSHSTAKVLVGGDRLWSAIADEATPDYVREIELSRADLNRRYMNVTFVGKPIQCEPNICDSLSKMIEFSPPVSSEESRAHKYMMDVDGNGWSGRFHRLLSTKHVVFKSTILPEWYSERIQPWYHYVPSKIDYSDLYDTMSFFVGGINGSTPHDGLAEAIATHGQDWARNHWRMEDMAAYMFRLILEWSRLYHRGEDGTSADFEDLST